MVVSVSVSASWNASFIEQRAEIHEKHFTGAAQHNAAQCMCEMAFKMSRFYCDQRCRSVNGHCWPPLADVGQRWPKLAIVDVKLKFHVTDTDTDTDAPIV